ncbi:MAG: GNAT family N-acetyltransferase [Candidatus Kaelpia aquatica]|nr:GNAT family N-acetyltransferase [Candidatus Kaelpia aquatica]
MHKNTTIILIIFILLLLCSENIHARRIRFFTSENTIYIDDDPPEEDSEDAIGLIETVFGDLLPHEVYQEICDDRYYPLIAYDQESGNIAGALFFVADESGYNSDMIEGVQIAEEKMELIKNVQYVDIWIAINPSYRGRGIAKKLYAMLGEILNQEYGINKFLDLAVTDAVGFREKFSPIVVGEDGQRYLTLNTIPQK